MRQAKHIVFGIMVATMVFIVLSLGGGGFSLFPIQITIIDGDSESDAEGTGIPVRITEMPSDKLSRDAVYVGSLTFAGLALFGSTLLAKATLSSTKTQKQKWGVALLYIASFTLIAVHIAFPFMYGTDGWGFEIITLVTLFCAGGVWVGYQLAVQK